MVQRRIPEPETALLNNLGEHQVANPGVGYNLEKIGLTGTGTRSGVGTFTRSFTYRRTDFNTDLTESTWSTSATLSKSEFVGYFGGTGYKFPKVTAQLDAYDFQPTTTQQIYYRASLSLSGAAGAPASYYANGTGPTVVNTGTYTASYGGNKQYLSASLTKMDTPYSLGIHYIFPAHSPTVNAALTLQTPGGSPVSGGSHFDVYFGFYGYVYGISPTT